MADISLMSPTERRALLEQLAALDRAEATEERQRIRPRFDTWAIRSSPV